MKVRICFILVIVMTSLVIPVPAEAESGWVCSYANGKVQHVDKFARVGNELREQPNDKTDMVEKALTDGLVYQIVKDTSEGIVAIMAEADRKEPAPHTVRTDIYGSMVLINKNTGNFEEVSTPLASPMDDTPPKIEKGTCVPY